MIERKSGRLTHGMGDSMPILLSMTVTQGPDSLPWCCVRGTPSKGHSDLQIVNSSVIM